ncbi:MAG: hypothetical protein ACFFCO_06545 [Promethearchaeota archaeon]
MSDAKSLDKRVLLYSLLVVNLVFTIVNVVLSYYYQSDPNPSIGTINHALNSILALSSIWPILTAISLIVLSLFKSRLSAKSQHLTNAVTSTVYPSISTVKV